LLAIAAGVPCTPRSTAYAQDHVRKGHYAARAADCKGGQEAIGSSDEDNEVIQGEGREARGLPQLPTREVRVDDIGVPANGDDSITVEIELNAPAGGVVYQDWDRIMSGHPFGSRAMSATPH